MKVNFTQTFGTFAKGTNHDLPDQVAQNLIRTGVATTEAEKPAAISTTQAYKPRSKAIRKDM